MNGETTVAVEEVLAAAVDSHGGRLTIDRRSMEKSYAGFMLAVDYDLTKEEVVITLVDTGDMGLEDE